MPDVSLSGIEFKIKGSTDSASDSINQLIWNLTSLNKALKSTDSVKTFSKSINSLSNSISKISKVDLKSTANSLKSFSKVSSSMSGFASVSKDIASFARGMSSLANNSDKLGDVANWLNIISQIDLSNLASAGQGLQSMVSALNQFGRNSSGVQTVVGEVARFRTVLSTIGSGAASTVRGLGTVIQYLATSAMKLGSGAIKTGVSSLKTLVTYPFKTAASSVKKYASSLSNVVSSFKRILFYRIIRSVIKEITQAFSEGISNLYQWSSLTNGTFKSSMDSITTSMQYFKNSIAAAVSPIINALAPAIDYLVDKVVSLINVINQLFAKLTGASYWTKAKKTAAEYADAASGAGDAAEEALHYLAPFDELNVMSDTSDSSSGSGSSTDYTDMFEETTEFSESISDFADMIRSKIEEGDWTGLGVELGNKINEIIDSIDWAGSGAKVGTFINALFTTQYWTLETINFTNIGSRVATFLNNAMENIDFNIIGRTLTQKFTIIGDFLIGAIEDIDWNLVGNSIRDFIVGAFNQLSQWLDDVDWGQFGSDVYAKLKDLLEGLDFAGIANSMMRLLGAAIGAASSFLYEFIEGVVDDIKGYFKQFIDDENEDGCFSGGEILEGILKGIDNGIKNIGTWLYNNVLVPFINGIKSTFGITNADGDAVALHGSGKSIANGILEGIKSVFVNIATWIDEHLFAPIRNAFSDFAENHPKIAALLGIGGEVEPITVTIDDSGFSGTSGTFEIDVSANVTSATDNIPESDKVSMDWGIDAKDWTDSIPSNKKTVNNAKANVTDVTNSIPSSKNGIDLYANLFSWRKTGEFKSSTADNWTGVGLYANLYSWRKTGSFKTSTSEAWTGTDLYANLFSWRKTGQFASSSSNSWTGIDMWANLFKYRNTMSSTPSVEVDAHAQSLTFDDDTTVGGSIHFGGASRALGGIFKNGAWSNIPQYASGGRPHGSLFLAGEAGAEIVGHVGGRTEVLNRSQLAATMYAAVKSAIASVGFHVSPVSVSGYSDDSGMMSEEMMYRAMLRALNDSDVFPDEIDLDGATVYRKMVNRNKLETMMTGINPMMSTA